MKKIIEYLIIATVIVILIYCCYCMVEFKFPEEKKEITDSVTMYYPLSSEYTVVGDKIEFRNNLYDFYNMDVSRLNSSDGKLTNLLNHFANFNQGTIDYKNETCYVITMEFEDDSGFRYHSMIIPYDSFDKHNLTFTKDTDVYLFDANNRKFVVDTAFNSEVAI